MSTLSLCNSVYFMLNDTTWTPSEIRDARHCVSNNPWHLERRHQLGDEAQRESSQDRVGNTDGMMTLKWAVNDYISLTQLLGLPRGGHDAERFGKPSRKSEGGR